MINPGIKFDGEKPRWELVPWAAMREAVKVMTKGAAKYSADNWHKVDHYRYVGALYRHMDQYLDPDQSDIDEELGLHHLACVACNALFLLWQAMNGKGENRRGA